MIRKLVRSLIYREKADSESFVRFLRQKGASIGEDVRFFSPMKSTVDLQTPWLITIGNHVNITQGVVILTHDYSWSVLKRLPQNNGRILGAQSPVKIGDNVFIGMNAVITRGVTIGNNVVIGTNSVVTSDCEDNSVYAGNPAKKIMDIDEYLLKREAKQIKEAKQMALCYYEKFGKKPPIEVFKEYFMLFLTAEEAEKIPIFKSQLKTCGNYEDSIAYMKNNPPVFSGYEAFLNECFK